MKPNSYPKVQTYGHSWVQDILDGEYIIEEKIDGSQISFGVYDREIHIRSKGAQLYVDNPDGMFLEGVRYIADIQDILKPEYTYRGEYLKKPKHNTLSYARIPKNHIIIFDIEDEYGNPLNKYEKRAYAQDIGLECVPNLTKTINTIQDMLDLLETPSILGNETIEGVVIKNYGKMTPDGKYMVGKYVSSKFKERHEKSWKETNKGRKEDIALLIESMRTDARYLKAVQRMRDDGQLTMTPKDIGNLLKILHQDIIDEESEYIKDWLYKSNIANIKRGVCGGFAEWYKDYLMREGLH